MSDFKPQIVGFCCHNCASASACTAQAMKKGLPDNVKIVQVPCTGRIEVLHLLKPFEEGADGVYVAGCQQDSCRYVSGITRATKRVARVKRILEQLDVEPDRIDVFNLSAANGQGFVEIAHRMVEKLRRL
ncbi:MAG: F420-nonreducing hydrogenase [Desulfobacterales bacterium S3730MH5]|nr:MAG: F420-nonreducing hydrogenase [Desulfobacterales bacterium S3730MH5]